ncbi:MAG: Crp/Fnr family transcriptional regulator [Treponema sp.]|nr:Crp/Fnr family transcriptional regulator [Treponema sp.]
MPKVLHYGMGSLIYVQGDEADKVLLLKSGTVNLSYQDIETDEPIQDLVQMGEFFGVKSALGRYPREENAITLQDATLMAFTVPEFEALVMANTRITMKMLRVLSNQLRRIHHQISRVMATKEPQNPELGLFGLGTYYLKNEYFDRAKYVFERYLDAYPSGNYAARAAEYLRLAELSRSQPKSARTPLEGPTGPQGVGGHPMTPDDLAGFSRFARTFRRGDLIFAEFEAGKTFYLIQSGRVELLKLIGDIEKTIDILYPSEIFGEMAILEDFPRSATAIALEEVKVLEFNHKNFEILMSGNPQIALMLLKLFAKRIYESKRRFMTLTLADDQARIADVFLMLDETQPNVSKDAQSREFIATIADIAHWAGMNTPQTRDVLYHFASQQRLEIFNDRIRIKNINDFSRLVNSHRNRKR